MHACKCEQLLAHRICVHVQARGAGLFTGKPDFRLRKDLHCVGSKLPDNLVRESIPDKDHHNHPLGAPSVVDPRRCKPVLSWPKWCSDFWILSYPVMRFGPDRIQITGLFSPGIDPRQGQLQSPSWSTKLGVPRGRLINSRTK